MFWDRETETLKRSALEALQLKRLQATVRRVAKKVPLYQQRFAEYGLKPRHIQSLADVSPVLRWALALGATAWLILGPVALYLTLRRD